jgi:hypothetical protein
MTGTINPALFGMPDATTAGVQAGVTLTNYTGPMTITTPGAVIENQIINGTLTVAADNVTIKNCIVQNFSNWGILDSNNAVNTRVEYCTIDGSGSSKTTGLGVGGGTNSAIIGCDIKGMVIAINMFGSAEIRDNYIHDLAEASSDPADRHFDGIRAMTSGAVIEHNTISMPTGAGGTAAVFIKTEWGPIDGVQVKDNLMTGDPSYTLYVESTTSPITNATVENNYVDRGIYGYFNVVNSTPIMSNNVQWNNDTDPTPYPTSLPTPPSSAPPVTQPTVDTTPPAAPEVTGDTVRSDNTVVAWGTAEANSTIQVYDGTKQVGTATTDANGVWSVTTTALAAGSHGLTATATDAAGNVSALSAAFDPVIGSTGSDTVDTTAPDAPVLLSDALHHHRATVAGTAEAGSTITLYEGASPLGTATTGADGHFSVTTSGLTNGSHTFYATATNAAGNTSGPSNSIDPPIGSHSATGTSTTGTSTVEVTNVRQHWDHTATIKGTADPNSQVKLSDGTTSVGTVTAGADGKWSFQTSDLSGKSHAFTAEQVDTTGHAVGTSSGSAAVGTCGSNTLTSTTGNDIMAGKGGADTFVFASNFGHDVIKDFAAGGSAHDTVQFSKSVFDSFASVLSHAAQSGTDVVIATGSDTLTLKNTQLDKLNSHDFHFA